MRYRYSGKQLSFLEKNYKKMSRRTLAVAFNKRYGINKTEGDIRSALTNHRFLSGRSGRFGKGHISWNKELKGKGICKANSGTFRKGNVPANKKRIGSERIDARDGAVLIKIKERNPYTGSPTRFKHKSGWRWEKKNGKKPKGAVVFFKDGNNQNFDENNLACISRAELLYINGKKYKGIPGKLKPTLLAVAKLMVAAGRKSVSVANRI